jgi:hypothetical protein
MMTVVEFAPQMFAVEFAPILAVTLACPKSGGGCARQMPNKNTASKADKAAMLNIPDLFIPILQALDTERFERFRRLLNISRRALKRQYISAKVAG